MTEKYATDAVFRTSLDEPGFALLDLGEGLEPRWYRGRLVELAQRLIGVARHDYECDLAIMWAGRFDQQVTTRPHRDDAPARSILILGYEPTTVRARLEIVDFSRYACERGLSPRAFLDTHNPMYDRTIDEQLAPFTTAVAGFDNARYQVLVINNGLCDCDNVGSGMLGVLHQATILSPDPSASRVVNSIMLADSAEVPGVSVEALSLFVAEGTYAVGER